MVHKLAVPQSRNDEDGRRTRRYHFVSLLPLADLGEKTAGEWKWTKVRTAKG